MKENENTGGDDTGRTGIVNYPKGRDPLLVERQKTHGDFFKNAAISQKLKQDFRVLCLEYEALPQVYKEAVDMIFLKLSRIASGQANFRDHWDDIAGYAKLASEACDK